jgi:hypothetical protein
MKMARTVFGVVERLGMLVVVSPAVSDFKQEEGTRDVEKGSER